MATGVAIVVFWPAAFFVSGGDGQNATELGRGGTCRRLKKPTFARNVECISAKGLKLDGTSAERNQHGASMAAENQQLERQDQRLQPQDQRVHEGDRVDDMQIQPPAHPDVLPGQFLMIV